MAGARFSHQLLSLRPKGACRAAKPTRSRRFRRTAQAAGVNASAHGREHSFGVLQSSSEGRLVMSCAVCTSGRRGSRAALARATTRAGCKQRGGAQAGPQTRGATHHGVCQSRRPAWQLSLVNEAVHLIGRHDLRRPVRKPAHVRPHHAGSLCRGDVGRRTPRRLNRGGGWRQRRRSFLTGRVAHVVRGAWARAQALLARVRPAATAAAASAMHSERERALPMRRRLPGGAGGVSERARRGDAGAGGTAGALWPGESFSQ